MIPIVRRLIDRLAARAAQPVTRHKLNVLDEGTCVMGDINLAHDTRVSCSIAGDVHCQHKLIIDRQGKVEGHVFAGEMIVEGLIEKDLFCMGHVRLMPGATVHGNLYALSVAIDLQADLKGMMQILTAAEIRKGWEERNDIINQLMAPSVKASVAKVDKQNDNFLARFW